MPLRVDQRPGGSTSLGDHEKRIRSLERKSGIVGWRFDFDNEGGWGYLQFNDSFGLDLLPDPLAVGGTWGAAFEDASGEGFLIGSTTLLALKASAAGLINAYVDQSQLRIDASGADLVVGPGVSLVHVFDNGVFLQGADITSRIGSAAGLTDGVFRIDRPTTGGDLFTLDGLGKSEFLMKDDQSYVLITSEAFSVELFSISDFGWRIEAWSGGTGLLFTDDGNLDINSGASLSMLGADGVDISAFGAVATASFGSQNDKTTISAGTDLFLTFVGKIVLVTLPISDPGYSGALWNSGGFVAVSP